MTDSGIGKAESKSTTTIITIVVFLAIALYNVAELNFIIFATFKRRSGLYFWSFVVLTWGIAIYSIGFVIKDFQVSTQSSLYITLIIVGWCSMVTGQSVVLYSRLYIVLRDPIRLRFVLGMVIINAIICHIPIIVMVYGANSNHPEPFLALYSIYEKFLRPEGNIRGKTSRRLMNHLIYVNVIVVLLDITILGLEYSGLYDIQTAYKALVYSVKLKLEFSILNRLVELTYDGHGVHIETFDGDRLKRQGVSNGQGSRYKAYIRTGGVNDAIRGGTIHQDDSVVVMTTEVEVHRYEDGKRIDREDEQDLENKFIHEIASQTQ
ncbi:hypothetical protein B0J14DRAFT_665605 [Halenospora varia]|nr:hypothetical protein B0J14DRAFT_665605 [Halenospora varia]